MALTRDKKKQVIDEVSQLLVNSRLTVFAEYSGTAVKDLQNLRRTAAANGTAIRVIKNRLFKKVLDNNDQFKSIDNSSFHGQLIYAFNSQDEVEPARNLAQFSAAVSALTFVGGLTSDGQLLNAEDVKVLAELPSKQQLRSQLAAMLITPSQQLVNVIAGNLAGVLNAFAARAEQLK